MKNKLKLKDDALLKDLQDKIEDLYKDLDYSYKRINYENEQISLILYSLSNSLYYHKSMISLLAQQESNDESESIYGF